MLNNQKVYFGILMDIYIMGYIANLIFAFDEHIKYGHGLRQPSHTGNPDVMQLMDIKKYGLVMILPI
jgi:hypothetical protein